MSFIRVEFFVDDLFIVCFRKVLGFGEMFDLEIEWMNEKILIKLIYIFYKIGNEKLY